VSTATNAMLQTLAFSKNQEDGLVEKTNYMRAPEFS
jgi:hypothetical protein